MKTMAEVLDGIRARHLNIRNSTSRADRAQYRDDHAALVMAVEGQLERWEKSHANMYMTEDQQAHYHYFKTQLIHKGRKP